MARVQITASAIESEKAEVERDVFHKNVVTGTIYSEGVQEQLDAACAQFGFDDPRWVTDNPIMVDQFNGDGTKTKVRKGSTLSNFGQAEYNKAAKYYKYGVMPTKYQCAKKHNAIPVVVKTYVPMIDKKTGQRRMVPSTFVVYNVSQTIGVIGTQPGQIPPMA